MLFLGYDPGGKGNHGVAVIEVSQNGEIMGEPTAATVEDAAEAWRWLSNHANAQALGIDTLLAWSPSGGRACDKALAKRYTKAASTVISQNSLFSSMTLNGAIVARRADQRGIPLFEGHPKLLTKVCLGQVSNADAATRSMLSARNAIESNAGASLKDKKRADDKADAVVAAWCAAQGYLDRWTVNLFEIPGDELELVVQGARYPWREVI